MDLNHSKVNLSIKTTSFLTRSCTKQQNKKSRCISYFELQETDSPLKSYANFTDDRAKIEGKLFSCREKQFAMQQST